MARSGAHVDQATDMRRRGRCLFHEVDERLSLRLLHVARLLQDGDLDLGGDASLRNGVDGGD